MIAQIHIKNFQSHRDTKLHFVAGINTIVGPSNSGKSSILRAMEWVLLNYPSGTEFISVGADYAEVTITLSSGYAVSRKRTRSNAVNTYTILYQGSVIPDGILTGFGSNVPPQVLDVLGMTRMEFGIAKQLEAPFLISETPKVRAETIGNLEEVARIDKALQEVNDDLRDNAKRQRETDVEIKKSTQEMQRLEKELKHDRVVCAQFEEQKERYDNAQQLLRLLRPVYDEQLGRIEQTLGEHSQQLIKAVRIVQAWDPHVLTCADAIEAMEKSAQKIERLQQTFDDVEKFKAELMQQLDAELKMAQVQQAAIQTIELIQERLGDMENRYEYHQPNVRFTHVPLAQTEALVRALDELTQTAERLDESIKSLSTADLQRSKAQDDLHQSLNDFMDSLHAEAICPLCEQKTNHEGATCS